MKCVSDSMIDDILTMFQFDDVFPPDDLMLTYLFRMIGAS